MPFEVWPEAAYQELAELNPGAGYLELQAILKDRQQLARIALVGHEPDFSEMVAGLIGQDGSADLQVKKASLVEVQLYDSGKGWLISSIPPRVLRMLGTAKTGNARS